MCLQWGWGWARLSCNVSVHVDTSAHFSTCWAFLSSGNKRNQNLHSPGLGLHVNTTAHLSSCDLHKRCPQRFLFRNGQRWRSTGGPEGKLADPDLNRWSLNGRSSGNSGSSSSSSSSQFFTILLCIMYPHWWQSTICLSGFSHNVSKLMQLGSPNLTWKWSTMSRGNPCWLGSLHSDECWLLSLLLVMVTTLPQELIGVLPMCWLHFVSGFPSCFCW